MSQTHSDTSTDVQELIEICHRMVAHENVRDVPDASPESAEARFVTKDRAEEYYRDLLPERFRFRRANGDVATKEDFIAGLGPGDPPMVRSVQGDVEVTLHGALAVASLRVDVTTEGQPDPKGYRNIRIFLREEATGRWRPHMWLNEPIPPAA